MDIKIVKAASLTLFVFGFAGWFYVVGNAWFHPETLSKQFTHLTPWMREDTFAYISFIISFISFFIWNLIREYEK